jgi:protein-disulfide isomerase
MESTMKSPVRLWLLLVVAALLGAGATLAGQMLLAGGSADKSRVEAIVHAYVLEHPEILPEAMERLRDRETAKSIAANRDAIVRPFPGAVAGNPNGDVTLVAYMDYACGFCRASLPALAQLIQDDPKLRVVYREFPVLSPQSVTAARWALAAAEQGKFKPFHDALYAGPQLSEASIQQAAQAVGLDKARAARAANSPAVEQEIARNRQTGQMLNITGTPSWVIGGQMISGAASYDMLKAAVDKARSAGA